MATVIFILHILIITVHLWSHIHHLKLYLSSLTQTGLLDTWTESVVKCPCVYASLRYLLRQNGDSLLVFGISQIDTVDGKYGVSDMQTSTSVCRLTWMDL